MTDIQPWIVTAGEDEISLYVEDAACGFESGERSLDLEEARKLIAELQAAVSEVEKKQMARGLPVKLTCRIIGVDPRYSNYPYLVTDPNGDPVATGISSSPGWVRHDAGGYHTKDDFDALYPNGWTVEFVGDGFR